METLYDCPECGREKVVEQINDKEAVCKVCATVFNISEDDDDTPTVDEESGYVEEEVGEQPIANDVFEEIDQKIDSEEFNNIVDIAKEEIKKDQPIEDKLIDALDKEVSLPRIPKTVIDRLGMAPVKLLEEVAEEDEPNVPSYILRTAEWKFAKVKKLKGNPYKEGTKSWKIFNVFDEKPSTVVDCFNALEGDVCESGITYLLSVYNVLRTCHAVGLLKYNKSNYLISVVR